MARRGSAPTETDQLAAAVARCLLRTVRRAAIAELLTEVEAASLVGYSKARFRELSYEPGFPRPVKVPGRERPKYRRKDLLRWIERLRPGRRKPEVIEIGPEV